MCKLLIKRQHVNQQRSITSDIYYDTIRDSDSEIRVSSDKGICKDLHFDNSIFYKKRENSEYYRSYCDLSYVIKIRQLWGLIHSFHDLFEETSTSSFLSVYNREG